MTSCGPSDVPIDVDIPALREKYAAERAKRLRPEGADQYLELEGEFAEFYERATASRRRPAEHEAPDADDEVTAVDPLEQISQSVDEIAAAVASELLERIKAQPPDFLVQPGREHRVEALGDATVQHATIRG